MHRTAAIGIVAALLLSLAGGRSICIGATGDSRSSAPSSKGTVDFDREIKPIMQKSCVRCHGPDKQKGGLRLDTGKAAMLGGNTGAALVPGKPSESRLFRLVAGMDAELKMPPGEKRLSAAQIELLRRWIEEGARWSEGTIAVPSAAKQAIHWAFLPPVSPALPKVQSARWSRNSIDVFVLARLERERIAPAPATDNYTLIRRVSLDLLGLPPDPIEVDAFVADPSPDAYERLVDRLLASPHYGERWGRHWLDVARYADSDGFEKDSGRPNAWRYRDWVINAINRNQPFDQFAVEQLAGDLLPGATVEQRTATGFHRNTLTNKEGGADPEQFRVEQVLDRVNTTAKVFLGMTFGCAQCHDHKYEPLTQRDFYRCFAYFNSDEEMDLPLHPGAVKGRQEYAQTIAVGKPRTTRILVRGDFLRPGAEVRPGIPEVLADLGQPALPNRLGLARWIVSKRNPLTARVIVNWVWQHYFGRGLVATVDDFGTQGERPSHPELLDWLATEFIRRDWDLKTLHRLIMTSAVYKQSSKHRPETVERDPFNVLLARQSRLRLEAEIVRDQALAASGRLFRRVGGPSVHPPQPKGIAELTYAGSARWIESKGADRNRRGLYTWFQRTSPYPMLMTFDSPDSNLSCVRRERSNTPLQALTLLNDANFVDCSRTLGSNLAARKDLPLHEQLRLAFRLCLTREPTPQEIEVLADLYGQAEASFERHPQAAAQLGLARPCLPRTAATIVVARALMNLDAFVVRD